MEHRTYIPFWVLLGVHVIKRQANHAVTSEAPEDPAKREADGGGVNVASVLQA